MFHAVEMYDRYTSWIMEHNPTSKFIDNLEGPDNVGCVCIYMALKYFRSLGLTYQINETLNLGMPWRKYRLASAQGIEQELISVLLPEGIYRETPLEAADREGIQLSPKMVFGLFKYYCSLGPGITTTDNILYDYFRSLPDELLDIPDGNDTVFIEVVDQH